MFDLPAGGHQDHHADATGNQTQPAQLLQLRPRARRGVLRRRQGGCLAVYNI